MNPLVTVVTVVYNAREDMEKTLRSVLGQTYENLEYIVVDGGSTDGTTDVIKKYENRIHRWISEPDKGPYDAMNKGIELARGEWINFMNAGDRFYDDDVIRDVFSDFPRDADFIYGNHYYRISEQKTVLREAGEFREIWEKMKASEFSIPWLQSIPCHQTFFSKTRLMKETKFNLRYKMAADYNFLFYSFNKKRRFFHTGKVIAVYSKGGMTSKHHIRCLREQWKIVKTYRKSLKVDFFFIKLIKKVWDVEKKNKR